MVMSRLAEGCAYALFSLVAFAVWAALDAGPVLVVAIASLDLWKLGFLHGFTIRFIHDEPFDQARFAANSKSVVNALRLALLFGIPVVVLVLGLSAAWPAPSVPPSVWNFVFGDVAAWAEKSRGCAAIILACLTVQYVFLAVGLRDIPALAYNFTHRVGEQYVPVVAIMPGIGLIVGWFWQLRRFALGDQMSLADALSAGLVAATINLMIFLCLSAALSSVQDAGKNPLEARL